MKKLIAIYFLFFLTVSSIFATTVQEYLKIEKKSFHYWDIAEFKNIEFYENNTVRFSDDENSGHDLLWNNTFNYELVEKDHFLFIDLYNTTSKHHLLVLLSYDNIIIYDSKLVFNGISNGNTEIYSFPSNVSASSELVEGSKKYYAKNISNLNLDEPWVEGSKGIGVGETINFSCNAEELIICSGFISVNKSYLWQENARPQKITISFLKSKTSLDYSLLDTPNPQIIRFNTVYSGQIEIKITDIYLGTKYEDTCIHSIMVKY